MWPRRTKTMIINYNIKIKNVKVSRLDIFVKYLNNDKHKNHTKRNTQIIEYSSKNDFLETTKEKYFKNNINYQKNKKGGRRLVVIGKSLTFNIPKSFEFDLNIGKEINNDINTKLQELYMSYDYKITNNEIYGVLHNQINPHYHFFIPYLSKEGKTLSFVKPKKFLGELKLIWNEIMIKHYGMTPEEYIPLDQENQNQNKNKRYLEELQEYYTKELEEKENKYIKNQLVKVQRLLKLNNKELDNETKQIDLLEKNLKKVLDYKSSNTIKMNR